MKSNPESPEWVVDNVGKEGRAVLFKKWLSEADANELFIFCSGLETKQHDFKWCGHSLKQKRLNWACGDAGTVHAFGGVDVPIHAWPPLLLAIRELLYATHGVYCNFCLVNDYPTGMYSIAPHSDGELHAKDKSVFTLSLGATRTMQLTQGKEMKHQMHLEHGDLFLMSHNFQHFYKHGIAVEPLVCTRRISLTFRSTLLHRA